MPKVAAIQMCSSENIDENLKTAGLLMKTAVENGARLVVLPEMFAIFSSQSNDKIHLFDVVLSKTESYKESDTTEPGNQVVVIDTPVGKLGLSVCYDIRFPGLFTRLLNAGAEIIAIPSAFTVKTGEAHWKLLCRARAVENFSYIIGACQEGLHSSGRSTYGHSLIVNPWGDVIQEKSSPGNGIIYANIDLDELHKIRESIPVLKHQRVNICL